MNTKGDHHPQDGRSSAFGPATGLAFVLVERGGSYGAAWEANVAVCLARKPLEDMAAAHHKKQRASRIRLSERSYMEIEEVPYWPNSAMSHAGKGVRSLDWLGSVFCQVVYFQHANTNTYKPEIG
jgi:hypothetical protein